MNTKIHISIHRIQKILKSHISKKFRYNVYVEIASVAHIMSHELIEIAIEKALENNRYQVTLDYLFDALNESLIRKSSISNDQGSSRNSLNRHLNNPDDTLTLCLLRHSNCSDWDQINENKEDNLSFKNYITFIKKDIIAHQLNIIGITHKEKITISKEIKEIVSIIITHHVIKLCEMIKYYTDFNLEKTIRYETVLLIYSIWMKSLNVSDETISEFHQVVQSKVDHYKK